MIVLKGTEEYVREIATYIKNLRLNEAKYTQKAKAIQCGIPIATYRKVENTGKGSIEMLIKILFSYGLLSKIDTLTTIIEPSPSKKMLLGKSKIKKRVRHSKSEG